MSATVFIIDDDADVRHAFARLVEGESLRVKAYDSAEMFLADLNGTQRGCIVLDVRLPSMTGPELQAALNARGVGLPIIFLTGHGDVPTAVAALHAGAFDFLEKPVAAQPLLDRIRAALTDQTRRRAADVEVRRLRMRLGRLTARELDVMQLVVRGLSNREVGERLNISHRTVEIHRGRVMQKMQASSLLALAEFAKRLDMQVRDPVEDATLQRAELDSEPSA
jgi:two-component system, LuxR family, response regulator FixJ